MTILDEINWARNYLLEYEIESYKIDSDILLEYVTGWNKAKIIINYKEEIDEEVKLKYEICIKRRAKKEPIAYIIGEKEFMGLIFGLNKDTLIPREDTEVLVRNLLNKCDRNQKYKILDMCTGSGCIAISLAHYLKFSNIFGVDISSNAINMSKENARRNNVLSNVSFIVSDLFTNVLEKNFDIIVSNPPYIKSNIIETLDLDVKDYEPLRALDGGDDGLKFYYEIIKASKEYLKKGGLLAFEIDYTYFEILKEELIRNDFENIELYKDFAGLDRAIIAMKKE